MSRNARGEIELEMRKGGTREDSLTEYRRTDRPTDAEGAHPTELLGRLRPAGTSRLEGLEQLKSTRAGDGRCTVHFGWVQVFTGLHDWGRWLDFHCSIT